MRSFSFVQVILMLLFKLSVSEQIWNENYSHISPFKSFYMYIFMYIPSISNSKKKGQVGICYYCLLLLCRIAASTYRTGRP